MRTQVKMCDARKKFLWTAVAAAVLIVASSLLSPRPAYGQFDTAAIASMLASIQSTINSTITPILNTMNTVSANMMSFQQTIMYPMNQIQSAQRLAGVNLGSMTSMQTMFQTPVNSATLSSTKSFETQLLSSDANNIGSLGSSYTNVFGSVPSSSAMNSNMRTVVDATDAQALDAYKKAVQLDSIANTEATLSQQYMQQLQSTAPGNATLVQAQAAAWNLQAAAYTQQGLDELLRVTAAENAYQSFSLKQQNTNHQQVLKNFGFPSSN